MIHSVMKLSQAIREGRRLVKRQGFRSFFQWDARSPGWRIGKNPTPNSACAVGMALLGVGWRPLETGTWDSLSAGRAAEQRWPQHIVLKAIDMNDKEHLRWDRIARRLERMGY